MGSALAIRDDLAPTDLRRRARRERNRRTALRLLAVANALEGMSRAEAARLAGMERQALRDAVTRYSHRFCSRGDQVVPAYSSEFVAGFHLTVVC